MLAACRPPTADQDQHVAYERVIKIYGNEFTRVRLPHFAPLRLHTYTQALLRMNTVHMSALVGRRLRRQLQYFNYEYASSAPMNDDRSGAYKFSVIY